ncbi:uncharacterized protein LOC118438562 [Folsomia candida]|uniref:uncharacterized protein LOC118438562 n=1 Tax=Folsomia candida TaxID=158441 RepID=UPI001604E5D9|nr:uncharacterized protein LOC118438562 [Folsomia candida]
MKMATSTRAHNLLSSLPEIIFKIMDFLPTQDIETTSLINSTWEREALRHLLRRNSVDVRLHTGTDSTDDLVPLRNLSPVQLSLYIPPPKEDQLEVLFSKIDSFTVLNFTSVTKFSLFIPVDNSLRHVASRFTKIHESFKNLKSLEFQFYLTNPIESFSSGQNWADLFPDSHVTQNLTNLSLDVSRLLPDRETDRWDHMVSLTTRLVSVFRHVESLKLIDTRGGLNHEKDLILPHLKSICLIRTFPIYGEYNPVTQFFDFEAPFAPSFANVRRLEFNILFHDKSNSVDLLQLLAPQLEHVCISGVHNTSPNNRNYAVTYVPIPVLPRLKVFEILREESIDRDYERNFFRPHIYLNFKSGRDAIAPVYGEHFPVLERLRVHVVPSTWKNEIPCPDENLHFEATMLFLYENFLKEGITPSETVKSLDIGFPRGEGMWEIW